MISRYVHFMQRRSNAFRYAINGIKHALKHETNFGLHVIALFSAMGLGLIFKITIVEWFAVLLCGGSVLVLEMVNTAIERLCDLIEPGHHPVIRIIKDVSAGAVLISACIAAILGTIIFLPYIFKLINS